MIPKSFTIETTRLKLRIPALSDIPYVFSATRYEGFNDGMLWDAPKTQEAMIAPHQRIIRAWEQGEAYGFTIERKDDGQFLGRISIRPIQESGVWNVGFWTHPEQQGKGIMTEALKAVINFGFRELSARKIEACYALWNKASERVLLKNGMTFSRYIEKGFQKKGKWVEENLMEIDRRDWNP